MADSSASTSTSSSSRLPVTSEDQEPSTVSLIDRLRSPATSEHSRKRKCAQILLLVSRSGVAAAQVRATLRVPALGNA